MNHRKFALSTVAVMAVLIFAVTLIVVFSSYRVPASIGDLPDAVRFLPAGSHAVFGMNVQSFVASPVYARFEAEHGEAIAGDLAEFAARTGVDPRRDLTYILAGTRVEKEGKGTGVLLAVGTFNTAAIETFLHQTSTPVKIHYEGVTVLMIAGREEAIERGVAFLSEQEIVLGDLDEVKRVIDVRAGREPGMLDNETLAPMLAALDPAKMFWFAGDAESVLAQAPAGTPLLESLTSIRHIVGTLDLREMVTGHITATARDEESARQLTEIARGLVALGQLAAEHRPEVGELMRGVRVVQELHEVQLDLSFPFELLEKLQLQAPRSKGSGL